MDKRPELTCPLCRGTTFTEKAGMIQTRLGFSRHRVLMEICAQCGNIVLVDDERHAGYSNRRRQRRGAAG